MVLVLELNRVACVCWDFLNVFSSALLYVVKLLRRVTSCVLSSHLCFNDFREISNLDCMEQTMLAQTSDYVTIVVYLFVIKELMIWLKYDDVDA